jgi:hypothetical protein
VQVFISWSGLKSHHVAKALRSWLPLVLDNKVKPFVSSEDIEKGDRGLNKIADQLSSSDFGVVVVTASNQNSPWINFEAGALGKSVSDGRVAPLLVGLTDADVKGPIKQFQNSEALDRSAVLSLVRTINSALDAGALSETTVNTLFKDRWPELEESIKAAPDDSAAPTTVPRGESDLLDEVLTTVRSLQRDVGRLLNSPTRSQDVAQDSEYLHNEVSTLLQRDLGISSLNMSPRQGELTVQLPDEVGTVQEFTVRRLQRLATRHGVSIIVELASGKGISYIENDFGITTDAIVVYP